MEEKTEKVENKKSRASSVFFCIKLLMIAINTIISVAGLVLLGFGVWMMVHGYSILQILGIRAGHLLNVSYFCVVAGCILALLGIFGCCGTIKESKIKLMLFFIALSVIFIGGVTCAIVVLIFKSIFHCCGLMNYTDFEGSNYQKHKGRLYPKSCCRNPFSAECDGISTGANIIYTKGCFSSVTTMIERNSSVLGGVAVGIGIIQLMAMVNSLSLFIYLFRI
ncbi:tetraspanin-1-like isoform X2 [Narcine bancroftii]|uniref:tetraspanin-1-like isoform X2 n=1 Tax=Narcine bancroftii TaxID=1343680 RepID=UPI003831D7FD